MTARTIIGGVLNRFRFKIREEEPIEATLPSPSDALPMHPEDLKAAIRKRFRSVAQFERINDLPTKSVNDLLRGRKSQRVTDAINKFLAREGL
ncbi:MAG: hypothetical protein DI623_13720 [Sphingomonas sanxanigenens]|uniref:Uncharacterized protein n=1 Tax=Sphingomonas sanxanigenens TaxID=397260 RepID=A0A2W5A306_9SPHN|nr:MAG: hypothetical protein DI623_13720 [Sphingomonas sanxanigenens]